MQPNSAFPSASFQAPPKNLVCSHHVGSAHVRPRRGLVVQTGSMLHTRVSSLPDDAKGRLQPWGVLHILHLRGMRCNKCE